MSPAGLPPRRPLLLCDLLQAQVFLIRIALFARLAVLMRGKTAFMPAFFAVSRRLLATGQLCRPLSSDGGGAGQVTSADKHEQDLDQFHSSSFFRARPVTGPTPGNITEFNAISPMCRVDAEFSKGISKIREPNHRPPPSQRARSGLPAFGFPARYWNESERPAQSGKRPCFQGEFRLIMLRACLA